MRSGGVVLDGDCRESGTFAFSAIRLNLAFSEISYCTFNLQISVKANFYLFIKCNNVCNIYHD